jgi:hypothetical protein
MTRSFLLGDFVDHSHESIVSRLESKSITWDSSPRQVLFFDQLFFGHWNSDVESRNSETNETSDKL